jgi:hypothetical protein
MQKDVILGCGNRSNAEMDTVTLLGMVSARTTFQPMPNIQSVSGQ